MEPCTPAVFTSGTIINIFDAAELAKQVNITYLDRAPKHVVAYLDPQSLKVLGWAIRQFIAAAWP